MGFETPEEGYLAKIVVPEGTKDVPIGKVSIALSCCELLIPSSAAMHNRREGKRCCSLQRLSTRRLR